MSRQYSKKFVVALFVVSTIVAGFAFGAYQGLFGRPPVPTMTTLRKATVLPDSMALPDFHLVDHEGAPFGPDRLTGRWSLVFFGFANCGHVCPFTLRTLADATRMLDAPPRIVFISVDPGRDTPDVLARYVRGFNADMTGVSGEDAEIRRLAAALGVAYTVRPEPAPYVVEHSPAVFVLDPQGRYTAVIAAADDAGLIAADLRDLVGATVPDFT
ncbi:MAG: SCO family protein [Gammaproteobacteria bacterium]